MNKIMGNQISESEDGPPLQRLRYDLTPIKERKPPIIWIVGPSGCGITTQLTHIEEKLHFTVIFIRELLEAEAFMDTERGKVIKYAFKKKISKVPDTIVVDLIKEFMLKTLQFSSGFAIGDFPNNPKQGLLFENEISQVHCVIYLYADMNTMVKRAMDNGQGPDANTIRKSIIKYKKNMDNALKSYGDKLEKISTNSPIIDTYTKIEGAIRVRYAAMNPDVELMFDATSDYSTKPSSSLMVDRTDSNIRSGTSRQINRQSSSKSDFKNQKKKTSMISYHNHH